MPRPRVLVNVAASADGKIDSFLRQGVSISSPADRARVDELRAGVDAVLVGGATLLAEDPRLTVRSAQQRAARREKGLPENPAKVGVVSEIPIGAPERLPRFLASGPARVHLFTTRRTEARVVRQLEEMGVEVRVEGEQRVDLEWVLSSLHEAGIRSVLVEGGGTLIAEFFRLGLVDELSVYVAPRIFSGAGAPTLADGPGFPPGQAPHLELVSAEPFDPEGGVLLRYRIRQGPANSEQT